MNNLTQITNFLKYLSLHGVSPKSLKYYKSDLVNFLTWANERKVSQELISAYINSIRVITPVSTLNRRISTLRSYGTFLGFKKVTNTWQEGILSRFVNKPKLHTLFHKLFFSRPNWYRRYHSYPLASYIHIAILVLFTSLAGYALYDQVFKTTNNSFAFPTALTRPNRYLSFQGRLTDHLGNPKTSATNMVYKLYSASSGGTALWSSGTCSITPDQDGIFSTLLGSSCGTEIASSVFSENSSIWLGATMGTDSEATPRVQIATVAYALNSETLQGYPAGTGTSTIPYMNSAGSLVLANASPKIQSTSGTFAVEGLAMTITTPNTSDGVITVNPDGVGTLDLTFEGTAAGLSSNGFVNATNANITSGALYGGTVASAATGYNFIDFLSGVSPTSKFSVSAIGNVSFQGALKPAGLAGTSGQFLISAGDNTAPTWTSSVSASTVPFSGITSSTNTSAAMVIGTGASLSTSGTGTIDATTLLSGTWATPGTIGSTTPNTGAFTTLSSTGVTTLGNNSATVAIDSSDWDINTTGDMSGIGTIGADGDITTSADIAVNGGDLTTTAATFNVANAATTLNLGSTNITRTINIGTGTSADTINIGTGGTTAETIIIGSTTASNSLALNDDNWNITGAGVANFVSVGATTAGTGAFTTLTSSGNSTIGTGASSINTIGSTTTPGTLTLHGATTLDNTFTVSGSNLTSLGGDLTVTGTAWTATPTISGLITAISGLTANGHVTLSSDVSEGLSGAGLVDCDASSTSKLMWDATTNKFSCGSDQDSGSSTTTLQTAYDNDVNGSNTIVALTAADDSLILRNPASAGTDSSYILQLDQLNIGAVDGLNIAQAGTGTGATLSFSNVGTTADGLLINNSAGTLTDAIDVSDATGITNAINVGANTILGTTANIDLTNFDVVGSTGLTTVGADLYVISGISTFSTAVSGGTVEATQFCTGDGETNCVTDFSAIIAGSGYWTRTAGNLYPTTLNDTLSATTSAAVALTLTQTGAFNALLVEDEVADATPFTIDQSGNVGIGGDLAINGGNITAAVTADSTLTVTGTLTANGTLDANGLFTLGDNGETGAIDTTTWDIDTSGNITTDGDIAVDGGDLTTTAATFNVANATTTLNLGSTNITRTINIGTGTSADTINIGTGGTTAETIIIGSTTASNSLALNDDNWNITGAGLANFVSVGATTAGTGAFTTLTSSGNTDVAGTLFVGTADAFQVSATGVITTITDETINGIDISAGTVSDVVNLTINSGGDLTIGAIGLNDVGSDNITSGSSLVGTFDEFAYSSSTNVQDVLDDLDAQIGGIIAGTSGLWTDGGTVTYLTDTTDDLAIGGTTILASMFGIDESAGNFYFGYDNSANPTLNFEATDADAGEFGFNTNDSFYFSNANVGIGDTSPTATLTVGSGDLFQVDGSTGNITTAGDTTVNGGDLITTAATFNIANAATILNLGSTNVTRTINIGTGTSADTINIGTGGTTAETIIIGSTTASNSLALNDDNWNITGAGAANFVSIGATTAGTGAFTTLTSSGNSTLGTGASSINTIGSTTTPGTLTLHGATTLDNTFTVSGSNLTSLGGDLTVTGDVAVNSGDLTTTATTFNLLAGATTLNIGPTGSSASSILLSGGSADTGCTIDGSSGNLACSGTITGTSIIATIPFSSITSATNTVAAMIVGAGASLDFTSTGTINSSSLLGSTWASPGTIGSTTPNTGVFSTLTSTGNLVVQGTTGLTFNTGAGGDITFANGEKIDNDVDGTLALTATTTSVSGNLKVTGGNILNSAGTANIIFSGTPTTTANTLSASNWLVENTANVGQAALMVNQTKAGDLFTASASGTPKFAITNSGIVKSDTIGTAKANVDIFELTNHVNAVDMDTTRTSILFNQWYYDASTPAIADAGRLTVGAETDWTSTASTQDAFLSFDTALDGTLAEKMRITSGGNVGIGTTAPVGVFSITGAPSVPGGVPLIRLTDSADVTNRYGIHINSTTNDRLMLVDDYTDVVLMTWLKAGNVGIGTITPGAKLEVTGTGDINIGKFSGNSATYGTVWATNSATDGPAFYAYAGNVIVNTGKVGIGTTAPGTKLEVAGGNIFAYNSSTLGSEIVDGWTNNASYPYETFTSSGSSITSAINTTGYGSAYKAYTTYTGRRYKVSFTLTLNSGTAPYFRTSADGVSNGADYSALTTNGGNSFEWTAGADKAYIVFYTGNGVAANYSVSSFTMKEVIGGDIIAAGQFTGGGTNGIKVTSAGDVGIGTPGPNSVAALAGTVLDIGNNNARGGIVLGNNAGGNIMYIQNSNGATQAASNLGIGAAGGGPSFVVTGQGNVGIGTTAPSYPLDVTGEIRSTSNIHANDKFISSRYGYAGTYLSTEVQGIWSIGDAYQIDTVADDFGNLFGMGYAYNQNGGSPFAAQHQIVFTSAGVVKAAIGLTSGTGYFADKVGIGTTAPARPLEVVGAFRNSSYQAVGASSGLMIEADGDVGVTTSSIRFKTDVVPYQDILSKVVSLEAVKFKWGENSSTPGVDDFGMIAEQVNEFLPELVYYESDGITPLGLRYEKMGVFAIEAVKELNSKIIAFGESITSKIIKTEIISPVANADLIIDLQPANSEVASQLIIKGKNDEVVTSFDAEGNATISGTLYANNIESDKIKAIEELLSEVESNQALLTEAANWNTNTATSSANFSELIADNLFVTGNASITSLFVTDNFTTKNINSLTEPLSIQSLASAPLEIMAGKIIIDTDGNTKFLGNVEIAGNLKLDGNIVIANSIDPIATESAEIIEGQINTNATAGTATLPAGLAELKIKNEKLKINSLIYITPVTSTQNKVLYVKSKDVGEFTIGFNEAIDTDVEFNWWIIELQDSSLPIQ